MTPRNWEDPQDSMFLSMFRTGHWNCQWLCSRPWTCSVMFRTC